MNSYAKDLIIEFYYSHFFFDELVIDDSISRKNYSFMKIIYKNAKHFN